MKNNIVNDISALYELSLSIGESMDLWENSNNFLKKLMAKKSLDFAAIWIKNEHLPGRKNDGMASLVYANPVVRISDKSIPVTHPVFRMVENNEAYSLRDNNKEYKEVITEKYTEKGNIILFKLNGFGVLKLYTSCQDCVMDMIEVNKLLKVMKKFAGSLKGNLSHMHAVHESSERLKSDQQHKLLFDHNPMPMIIYGLKEKNFFAANDAFKGKYGYRFKELRAMKATAFIPEDLFIENNSDNSWKSYMVEHLEYLNHTRIGQPINVNINARIIDFNGVPAALVLFEDITQSKQIQKDLSESEKKYRGIFETLSDVYAEVSIDGGEILEITPSVKNISGYSREYLLGKKIADFYVDPSSRDKLISDLYENKGILNDYEVVMKNISGNHVPTSFSIHLQRDKNGNPEKIVGTMRDISYRKKTENELKKAKERAEKADKAKSSFLATMSHEIRNPMSAIIGNLNIMADKDIPERLTKYHKRISVSADNLLHIINNILDFSKIEAGEFNLDNKPFDLKATVESLIASVRINADIKDIKLEFNIDPRIDKRIIGDKQRINQILTNLVSNAIKFTEKGTITVSCILVGESENHYDVAFNVTDTGIGIENDKLGMIFESFKQAEETTYAKYGGTGLGLAISKSLVTLMGGEISVESEKNRGSTFSFTLGFNTMSALNKELSNKKEKIKLNISGLKVLLVEDDPLNRDIGYEILSNEGCNIDVAVDGLEAVKKTSNNNYDFILMDLRMPKMGGIEATRIIRNEQKKDVPILALTAEAVLETINSCFDAGMNGYLLKPFEKDELLNKINKLLNISNDDKQKLLNANKIIANKKCLIVDDDESIIEITQNALAQFECEVDLAYNGVDAINKAAFKKYDFILMDLNMPKMDGVTAAKAIRKKWDDKLVIIGYSSNDAKRMIKLCKENGMDDLILKSPETDSVLVKISEILEKKMILNQDQNGEISKSEILFDLSVLKNTFNNDESLIASSLQKFVEITPMYLDQLNTYYSEGNLDKTSDMAHNMKSSFVLLRIESLIEDVKLLNNLKYTKKITEEVEQSIQHINEKMPLIIKQMKEKIDQLSVFTH